MVENSTKIKEVNYESLYAGIIEENKIEVSFEDKIRGCISQLAKDPKEETIQNILNFSKTVRNL